MQSTLDVFSYAIFVLFPEEKFEKIQKQAFIWEASFLYKAEAQEEKKKDDKEQSLDLKKIEMQVSTPGPKTVTVSLQWQMHWTSITMILQQAMDDRILKLSFSTFKQYLNFKHELLANFSKTVYF